MTEVTDQDVAKMVMMEPFYTNAEIGEELGMSVGTVSKYLNQTQEQVREADDWEAEYYRLISARFTPALQEQLAQIMDDLSEIEL